MAPTRAPAGKSWNAGAVQKMVVVTFMMIGGNGHHRPSNTVSAFLQDPRYLPIPSDDGRAAPC
jgi:hypothetical protein